MLFNAVNLHDSSCNNHFAPFLATPESRPGLKPHTRHEVQALQPLNLSQTTGLAKLKEDNFPKRSLLQ